ncbi:unnamed protein product [Rotaria magnacalcarata]|uniref:Uncharacterized protein n=2 Tax=Rotaria magnacalcarata TaxID=392030 RepID=A0A816PZC7_9BILA|nr:unnamed protein product [Rotaria magnacalcarata]CAF3940740.1 unnamed protein product [Rotaria magnacalcarata]
MTRVVPFENRRNLRPDQIDENIEDINLIWLDQNIDDSPTSKLTQSILCELNECVRFYTDIHLCIDYVKTIIDEKVFLVTSGSLAKDILSEIHSLSAIVSVFIFCSNRQRYVSLCEQYSKIQAICIDQQSLVDVVKKSANAILRQTMTFMMFDEKKQKTARTLSKRASSFLWYQMFIDVLKKLPQMDQAKIDMLKTCEDYYCFNKQQLSKIEQFRTSYTINEVIRWFTLDSFVYRLLNRALRTENISHLYLFRFFIIDLCKQLEHERTCIRDRDILHLYRGQIMSSSELNDLKDNIGNLISTNSFLSTSRRLDVAMQFILGATDTDELKVILFEIEVDCQNTKITFADIDKYSQLQGEEEVLFSLGTVFCIEAVEFVSTLNLWKVKMTATDELSNKIKEAFNLTIGTENRSPSILFGNLLINEYGLFDIGEKFFQMLLKNLSPNHDDIFDIYTSLSKIYRQKEQYKIALDMALKAYDLRRKVVSRNCIDLNELLNLIARIYLETRKYKLAIKYYQESLVICEKNNLNDHPLKTATLHGLGEAYKLKSEFYRSLFYFMDAYEIAQRTEHLPDMANCIGDIGLLHENQLDYETALSYYYEQYSIHEKALELDQNLITEQHLFIDLMRIVETYRKNGNLMMAFGFCKHRLIQLKRALPENHQRIGYTLKMIADIYMYCGDASKVLEYYLQALEVFENSQAYEQLAIIQCLRMIGALLLDKKQYDDGLNYWLKALDIEKNLCLSDDSVLAESYKSIGDIYCEIVTYQKALYYYAKALGVYRKKGDQKHMCGMQNEIMILKRKMIYPDLDADHDLPDIIDNTHANETVSQRVKRPGLFRVFCLIS